jgi:hypothetical protein
MLLPRALALGRMPSSAKFFYFYLFVCLFTLSPCTASSGFLWATGVWLVV